MQTLIESYFRGPVVALDMAEVGAALVLAIITSRHLRHAHPMSTARDYLTGELPPEQSFVRDVLRGTKTKVLMATWFSEGDTP